MKVIINSTGTPRKEYTNLPERDPNDPIRQRLGEKRNEENRLAEQQTEKSRIAKDDTLLQNEFEAVEATAPFEANSHRDFFEDLLNGREAEDDEHTGEKQSWKHSRRAPLVFVGVLLALGGILYFAAHSDRGMPLERISVRGANLLSDRAVIALAGIDRNQHFYSIDLKKLQERLMQHSLIKMANPRRELNPSTIVLEIEERQPVAMLRSDSTGEAYIIDRDGMLLRPKVIAGLRDPAELMQVPLLSGVSERDTVGFRAMARLVGTIAAIDSGALRSAMGELRRTPTGAYVLYTSETQTPIFIGSPFDAPFRTAIEAQLDMSAPKETEPLFTRQLRLLAKVWKTKLQTELRTGGGMYVDARFSGQIVLKHRGPMSGAHAVPASMQSKDSMKHSLLTSVMKSPAMQGH